jgi:hypothetical protein
MLTIMLIYAQIMLFYAYFYAFMLKLCFYAFMLGVCHYAFFYASIIGTSQGMSGTHQCTAPVFIRSKPNPNPPQIDLFIRFRLLLEYGSSRYPTVD